LGYNKELEILGIPNPQTKDPHNCLSVIVNQSQNQKQVQVQEISIYLKNLLMQLKRITGKQFQELESIITNPTIKDKKLKLKEFF
jgi:hypothetical protein